MKALWDQGKVAIIQGIGYPNPNRSHFRSMDIWHTCEPDKVGTEGWLGRAIREIDPHKDNVLTGVNFGRGLPRALAAPGVPVASVGNLETYGVLTGIEGADQRTEALDLFARMYSAKLGSNVVREYISQTSTDALSGADILSTAPQKYASTVQYESDTVGQYMRNIAQVHLAGLGTKILYTTAPANSFDTHATEMAKHPQLWHEVSSAVHAFHQDLQVFDADGNFIARLTGDATVSRWGKEKLDANAEMWVQRQGAQGLEREKQFWGPIAVEVDDENRVFVAETVRSRVQVYRKQVPFFVGDRL